jgi:Family of unknown function (DUF5360)
MLATDLAFVIYWLVTALHIIPPSWAYSDARDPTIVAWNWSFLPLDLLVSATGLTALTLDRRRLAAGDDAVASMASSRADAWLLLSLALTVCSGLQAISFWAMRCQLDVAWWIVNGFLIVYPLPYLVVRLRPHRQASASSSTLDQRAVR